MQPQATTQRVILRGDPLTRGNIATLLFVSPTPDKLYTQVGVNQNKLVQVITEFRAGIVGGTVTIQLFEEDGTTQVGVDVVLDYETPSAAIRMSPSTAYLHLIADGNTSLEALIEVTTSADCSWNDLKASQFAHTITSSGGSFLVI